MGSLKIQNFSPNPAKAYFQAKKPDQNKKIFSRKKNSAT